ncbi:hypothetical protein GCM10010512_35150 [Streptomyces thermoviolaceus subsp. thermoviolaceus]|nr:hypothetical protein GCM10010499_37200 [Streptomyces thermoviolaceus subsp. apingens]GHB00763.1 hypothetical protein GCM10010512_35150 [Streptomyces thermoviolaceus subsp. thermoviolaceus]
MSGAAAEGQRGESVRAQRPGVEREAHFGFLEVSESPRVRGPKRARSGPEDGAPTAAACAVAGTLGEGGTAPAGPVPRGAAQAGDAAGPARDRTRVHGVGRFRPLRETRVSR